jgi:hypothetical protein
MKSLRKANLLLWLSIVVLWAACARVVAPTGGVEDKTPPKLLSSIPKDGQVQVPRKGTLVLELDEWIEPTSVLLPFSPPLAKIPRAEVHGRTVEIHYQGLDSATTYSVDMGGIKDLRSNPLGSGVLVFSSGLDLDSLRLQGRVILSDSIWGPTNPEMRVALYPVGNQRKSKSTVQALPDSLRSSPLFGLEQPYYQATCDSMGYFELRGLAPGNYRVFAFTDLNSNRRFDIESESWGLGNQDIELPGAESQSILLSGPTDGEPQFKTLWMRDGLDSVAHIQISGWKKGIPDSLRWLWEDSTEVQAQEVFKTSKHLILEFKNAPLEAQNTSLWVGSKEYRIRWEPSRDSSKSNPILVSPKHKFWLKDTIVLTFDRPQESRKINEWVLKGPSGEYPTSSRWLKNQLMIWPTVEIPSPSSLQLVQKSVRDTTVLKRWDVPSPRDASIFRGNLGEKGNWRAQLLDTQDGRIFEVTATDGIFEFAGIPIGSYVLQAYLDFNSNQKWDPGQLQPWAPAETWLRLPLVFPLKSGVQELSDLFNTLER